MMMRINAEKKHRGNKLGVLLLIICLETARCYAQPAEDPRQTFLSAIPDSPGSVIVGRPTDHSVTLNILYRQDARVVLHYGIGEQLDKKSEPVDIKAGESCELVLGNLLPDTTYNYRIVDALSQKPLLPENGNGRFITQRAGGKPFTFTVQSDSHLDGGCSTSLYELTLQNALRSGPDFHIDLGDTFMSGKIPDRSSALKQYEAQRYWLSRIGQNVPLFLVVGNHDGEETFRKNAADPDGLAVWANLQRKQFFSNPVPDGFYSGNTQRHQVAGLLQDYYAWEWGDALFVVLNPYWNSDFKHGGKRPWDMTLGLTQYSWLAKTLRGSTAKFKFVFIHQLTGGLDNNGRGGLEAAGLYEWGGHEKDGEDTFQSNRPDWEKPIHNLLVETGVAVVFHGHDHFFARQELDGVIYQLVPQPAHKNFRNDHAQEYGYLNGDFLPNSGYLRVRVSAKQVIVDYMRTADRNMQNQGIKNDESAFSYSLDVHAHNGVK